MKINEPFDPAKHGPSNLSNGNSLGDLIVEITQDLSRLVRKEIALAKQETAELIRPKLMAAALIAAGVICALLLLPLILFTIIAVLATFMPTWAAALTVTIVTAAGCAGLFILAKAKLAGKLMPERTIRSLKEDVAWAKRLKK